MGLIHLDAGVVIGLLDAEAMAASAFAECLVAPSRRGERAVSVVEDLVKRLPIDIVELDAGTARIAAALRARHRKLPLPDALVIATGVAGSADELITTDRGWPTMRALGLDMVITRL